MTRLDNDLISRKDLLEEVKLVGKQPLPDIRTLKDLEQAIVNTYHAILILVTNAPTNEADSGEPVATVKYYDITGRPVDYNDVINKPLASGTPLYTSPQKREWVELTDKQIHDVIKSVNLAWVNKTVDLSRAISAKLKEVNHG